MIDRKWPGVWYLLEAEPMRERKGSFVVDATNIVHLVTAAGSLVAPLGVTIFEGLSKSPRVPLWILRGAQAGGYRITAERRPSLHKPAKAVSLVG